MMLMRMTDDDDADDDDERAGQLRSHPTGEHMMLMMMMVAMAMMMTIMVMPMIRLCAHDKVQVTPVHCEMSRDAIR